MEWKIFPFPSANIREAWHFFVNFYRQKPYFAFSDSLFVALCAALHFFVHIVMLKHLLKRFATAMMLIITGLGAMIFFMKSSKPEAVAGESHHHATSEDHKQCAAKIAGKPVPPLSLRDITDAPFSVMALSEQQSVIVIRYLGYGCSHCIEQLLALQKLSDTLKTKNIRVIAFSEDTPEQNAGVMKKYAFDPTIFTLASDPTNASARSLGAVYPETDGTTTELHVSMVIRQGIVRFAHFDTKPMMDVQTLLTQAQSAEAKLTQVN